MPGDIYYIKALLNRLLRMCAHLGPYDQFGNVLLPAYLALLTPYLFLAQLALAKRCAVSLHFLALRTLALRPALLVG